MRKTFYEKVGRRYKEVSYYDSDLFDSMGVGSHLVMVSPGGKSIRYNIEPALAPMIAAGRFAEREIADSIYEATRLTPTKLPITDEQLQAWENLSKAFGDEMYTVQRTSTMDITQAGVAAMQREADKLLKNLAVRAAYEEFMLLCELAKEHEND